MYSIQANALHNHFMDVYTDVSPHYFLCACIDLFYSHSRILVSAFYFQIESLQHWRANSHRTVWFKVSLKHAGIVPVLSQVFWFFTSHWNPDSWFLVINDWFAISTTEWIRFSSCQARVCNDAQMASYEFNGKHPTVFTYNDRRWWPRRKWQKSDTNYLRKTFYNSGRMEITRLKLLHTLHF